MERNIASTFESRMKVLEMNRYSTVELLRQQAFELSPAEQYRLAFFIAENIGYELKNTKPVVCGVADQFGWSCCGLPEDCSRR